jgi:2-octaprenylphenol hydroxylase
MEGRGDVIVMGAGPVGATLACLLGRAGLNVVLIESTPHETDWAPGTTDLRVSAITAASERIFIHADAWPRMQELGVSPFREMHVWDATGGGEIHFDCADIGEPRIGHIVENRVIVRALIEGLKELPNVTLVCPAMISALHAEGNAVHVELADGMRWAARLAVGADGINSLTRRLAGITVYGWAYPQRAVVATVRTERPHLSTAWQRFLSDGPLAFLPLRDGRCSIVWSTSPSHADGLLAATAESFMEELGWAFDHRLGRVTEAGPRASFPLRLQHAHTYIGPRLALVGDAAHAIHPLAGQGANLGLLDAAALAQVVLDAAHEGRDFGTMRTLRRYERWRKGDNLLMMTIMDGFQRLFGSRAEPLRLARNAGLSLFDALPPLKNTIMRHAAGLKGDLPASARSARI